MSEPQGATRTNISVPRELKARMDGVTEAVNWSAVACDAFRAKLLELDGRKGVTSMEDVIARLKAADEADTNEERQQGLAAGEEWAKKWARPKHLRRLQSLVERKGGVEEAVESCIGDRAARLYAELNGGISRHDDRQDVVNFWESAIGEAGEDLIEGSDFAEGFIEGALGLWEKIEDEV